MNPVSIEPAPTEEEAAAIVAALTVYSERQSPISVASRWKMAGRDYGGPSSLDYGTFGAYARDDITTALRAYARDDIFEDP